MLTDPFNGPTVEERYQRDPHFYALVNMLEHEIRQARFTPTEIREAAMLAQIRYEQRTFRRREIIPLRALDGEPWTR